ATGDTWTIEELPVDLGEIASLAMALGPNGLPRVIATTHDTTGFAVRSLAIVDDTLAVSVVADRLGAFTPAAVSVGASGPHVVFTDEQNRVVHASRPTPNAAEPDLGRRGVESGCAESIVEALADEPASGDVATNEKHDRDCEWLDDPQGLTAVWLAHACDGARDANACLLAGLELAPRGKVGRLRASSRVAPCEPMKTDCYVSVRTQAKLPVSRGGADEARAAERFERTCELGYAGGCLLRGELADGKDDARAIDDYRRACNAHLPSACAGVVSMVATKRAHLEDNQLAPVRAALVAACTEKRGPDACNALAFLMERGLGGPKEDASSRHLEACERGSAQSCVRLLVGPGARGPAPNVAPAALDATLREACAAGPDGCYARALALESGWGLARDDAAAGRAMSEACTAGSRSACARAGR
ncbi:MAG TPA: hypothetical protein VIF62_13520, partial [Labilithrix sp.]